MANKQRTRSKQAAASGSTKSVPKATKAAPTSSASGPKPTTSASSTSGQKPTTSASSTSGPKPTTSASSTSGQKPTTSASSTSPKVSAEQSVQLVQSLLHAGISCVAYLRQLFPEACFMQRNYENRDDHWDYDEWVAGNKGKNPDTMRRGSVVPVLKRETHREADRILDWLEKGVFDALRKGYLKNFQFQILQNQDRPAEVMETYDFRVRYAENTGEALVEIGMSDGKQASIASARIGFSQMIKKLTLYTPTLADLPRQRSVRIQLGYNDDCPLDYEAPGFVAGTSDKLAFPSGEGWARKIVSMGEMVTGRHGLSLRINHLEQRDPTVPETEIPTNLAHDDITELLDDTPAENFEPQDERMAHKEASDISERSYLKTALQDTLADDNSPDTQPLNVSSQNLELQGMPAKQQEVRELSTNKRAALERTIANDGLSSPLQRRSTGIDLRGLGSSDKIKCECGWEGEDADQMLQCQLCETWQHAFCYGYLGRSDLRMPKDRFCYTCLTKGEEPKLLRDLQSMALMRCGIRHIKRVGFTDDSSFAKGLGIDRQSATRLSSFLREKKYLVPVPGQKKTAKASAQGPCQIVGSGTAHRDMMDECFDPFKSIEFLYVPRSKPTTTLASSAASSQSYPAVRSSRKGKERATSQVVPPSSNHPPTRPMAPVATMQTPSRKRRSTEDWVEEVGRRVTPKRACKNSVSNGFADITYLSSPMGASVYEETETE
ncbi:HORMA domain-containing protein [Phyllosticta capitalensis]